MKTKPRLLSVSLAAVLSVSLLAVQPASALTVFDPSNFVQNTLTAIRTLEQGVSVILCSRRFDTSCLVVVGQEVSSHRAIAGMKQSV